DQTAVHLEVARGGLEKPGRERIVALAQIDFSGDGARGARVALLRSTDDVQFIERRIRSPAGDTGGIARTAVAGADELPARRCARRELEREQRVAQVRIPERAAGKVDAVVTDRAGGFAEAARVFLARRIE